MPIDYSRLAIPKPEPRWKSKQAKVTAEKKAERECYAQVDRRDGNQCRICLRRVGGLGMLDARHHHHLTYRSKGGESLSMNVIGICVRCHSAIHNGEVRVSGNADLHKGVKLEKATEAGWTVERWV